MTHTELISQIKKLLALAGSPNKHEAALAYNRAKELMARHCIASLGIDTPEEVIQAPYCTSIRSTGLVDNLPYIAVSVGKPFGVYVLMSTWRGKGNPGYLNLVGFKTNIELVSYALDCILNQCLVDFKTEYKLRRSTAFGAGFWAGVTQAMSKRFAQVEESQSEALVVYDPVKRFMDKFTGHADLKGGDSTFGQQAGFGAGMGAALNVGLSSGNQGNLLR